MAFATGGQNQSAFSRGNAQVSTGQALQEITTEGLGFLAFAGDDKLQFCAGWPADSPPPPTSSLLSVSSAKGLIAAASPDSVVVATTTATREAFSNDASATNNVKPFEPQLVIRIGTRISQVAFSSDGIYLVISAENGGGLAVYETSGLLNGNTQSTFELGTDQVSVRALVPNPAPESASLFALVTTKGDLLMADMKTRGFANGQNGKVLLSGVSCVSWSNKGKQLVAGLGNGTATQMTPEGAIKAELPRPSDLEGDQHVSSAFWLENDVFLMAYTPSATEEGLPPASNYRLITRQPKTQNYSIQELPEVCSPFGFNRQPSYQFLQRLRHFPPSLQDVIIVASTSSEDIGLYTRSEEPLASDSPNTKGVFTMTSLADDSRRAQVPLANMTDVTSPIGMALDLSSSTNVPRPIPGDDIEHSSGPLPALLVLNHLGVLSGWWIVYSESVRKQTTYPGLVAVDGTSAVPSGSQQTSGSHFGGSAQTTTSAFGSPAFGSPSTPALDNSRRTALFGSGTFGSPAALGDRQSPWGGATSSATPTATSTFGKPAFSQPAFGATSQLGAAQPAAFGSVGQIGAKPSLWGSPTQPSPQAGASTGSFFGQASTLGSQQPTGFGGAAAPASVSGTAFGSSGGGFASFASTGRFGAPTSDAQKSSPSIFKQGTASSFANPNKTESAFGSLSKKAPESKPFGSDSSAFTLGSAWTNPNAGKNVGTNNSDSTPSTFGTGFSSGFASALGSAEAGHSTSKETDMMSDQDEPPRVADSNVGKTAAASAAASSSLFVPANGSGVLSSPLSKPVSQSTAPTSLFASKTPVAPTTNTNTSGSSTFSAPLLKESLSPAEGKSREEASAIPEAPLPPDTTSKASYTPGNSSNSSVSTTKPVLEEPPLPPLPPASSSTPAKSRLQSSIETAPLPPDFTPKSGGGAPHHPSAKTPEAAPLPAPSKIVTATSPLADVAKSPIEAPLPPDFLNPPSKGTSAKPEISLPKTKSLGIPELVEPEEEDLPESDGESSGVDVGHEIEAGAGNTPDLSPISSFGARTDKLSTTGSFQNIGVSRENSKTLFGEIAGSSIPNLGPPRKAQDPESPRSPSPVRAARTALRAEASRSVSAPGVPLRTDSSRKVTLGRPVPMRGVYPPIAVDQGVEDERKRYKQQLELAQAAAEEELSDGDDERTRVYLETEVTPSLELEPFVAHQDYIGSIVKDGIPGQVERVYRDINSMVDTLGLNSRALTSFIQGHEELYPDGGRSRKDLEHDNGWALCEIDNLLAIQEDLEADVESEELKDSSPLLNDCTDMLRELARLRTRQADIKYSIEANNDQELLEALRAAPLSAEQSSVRHDLRAKYTEAQRVLTECEEAVAMLKAKAASIPAVKAAKVEARKIPTVEAVERTILKMTGMFEKRSGDIDVLEVQMRQLNVTNNDDSDKKEDSPFMTPPSIRRRPEASPASSMNGRASFYTAGSRRSGLANSVNGTPSRLRRSQSKKLVEIDEELAKQFAAKAARKRQVRTMLKETLVNRDMRVRTLDDL